MFVVLAAGIAILVVLYRCVERNTKNLHFWCFPAAFVVLRKLGTYYLHRGFVLTTRKWALRNAVVGSDIPGLKRTTANVQVLVHIHAYIINTRFSKHLSET